MDKKPYTAPELVVLGDVIDVTQSQLESPFLQDANYFTLQNPPNFFTDNIVD